MLSSCPSNALVTPGPGGLCDSKMSEQSACRACILGTADADAPGLRRAARMLHSRRAVSAASSTHALYALSSVSARGTCGTPTDVPDGHAKRSKRRVPPLEGRSTAPTTRRALYRTGFCVCVGTSRWFVIRTSTVETHRGGLPEWKLSRRNEDFGDRMETLAAEGSDEDFGDFLAGAKRAARGTHTRVAVRPNGPAASGQQRGRQQKVRHARAAFARTNAKGAHARSAGG